MIEYVLRNLRYRRRRTLLTVLGIVIGTTLILTLLLLGEGMKRAVASRLQSFGGDLVFIFPGKEDNPFVGMIGNAELRDKDVEAVREAEGVRSVMPMQSQTVRVELRGEEKPVLIHGSPWLETRLIFEESQGFGMAEGRWPSRDDAREAVLGSRVAGSRFSRPIRINDTITVRGRRFTVAGILKETGDSVDDSFVYLSLEQFRRATGNVAGVNSVVAKVSPGFTTEDVAATIQARLERQRGIADFVVLTPDKALRLISDILGVIQVVLGGIAAVALVVGGVGILNTMFTAVLERTREIGVLMAIGATRRRILAMFLTEAGLLGAFGGLVGAIVSVGLAEAAEFVARRKNFPFLEIRIDPLTVVFTLAFAFALGVVFGVAPAWQASRLRPTDALRYE